MLLTRRQFLGAVARAGAALPVALVCPGGAPLASLGSSGTGLSVGSVAGDVTADGAVIWFRGDRPEPAALDYGMDPSLDEKTTVEPLFPDPDCDNTVRVTLQGLEPATAYYYRIRIHEKRPGPVCRFITAPGPEDNTPIKFCFSGDTREGYQPFAIMGAMQRMEPHFFIHLGDTIYADRGGVATRLPDFWAKYHANRADPYSQQLFAHTGAYVLWDDHEVFDNYEGSPPLARIGRKAFFDYWPVRRHPAEPDRLYRSFRWGRALDVFLLDSRQYRDRAAQSLLGREQKEWLFEGLLNSSALFKCVATPVPLYGGGSDRWDGFGRERAQLFEWIRAKKIRGVFFISSDLHYAAVRRLPRNLREITVGPIAAPLNVIATGNSRRFEFFSNQTFNYGMITIDPAATPPRAAVEILDEVNNSLWKSTIDH